MLDAAARAGQAVGEELVDGARGLGAALDALRSQPDAGRFVGSIEPLDVEESLRGTRVGELSAWVGQVADALRAADVPLTDAQLPERPIRRDRDLLVRLPDGRTALDLDDRPQSVRIVRFPAGGYALEVVTWGADGGEPHVEHSESVDITAEEASGLVISLGGGDDTVSIPADLTVPLTVVAGRGDDVVGGAGGPSPLGRSSGGGDDQLYGGHGDDTLLAGEGDDRLDGGTGDDVLEGQAGADVLIGGAGRDAMWGGRGRDRASGNSGDDVVEGGSGDDDLTGGDGDDLLSGGRDDDRLDGGAGDDTLIAGRGADEIGHGAGDDIANVEPEDAIARTEFAGVRVNGLDGEPGWRIEAVAPPGASDATVAALRERLDADLEHLRGTTPGRRLLEQIDAVTSDDRRIQVRLHGQHKPGPGYELHDHEELVTPGDPSGRSHLAKSGGIVLVVGDDRATLGTPSLGLRYDGQLRSPIVGSNAQATLQHELVHARDRLHGGTDGTLIERTEDGTSKAATADEVAAVGLDVDGDGERDPITLGDGTKSDPSVSENAYAEHVGRDERKSYHSGDPDVDYEKVLIEDDDHHRSDED